MMLIVIVTADPHTCEWRLVNRFYLLFEPFMAVPRFDKDCNDFQCLTQVLYSILVMIFCFVTVILALDYFQVFFSLQSLREVGKV